MKHSSGKRIMRVLFALGFILIILAAFLVSDRLIMKALSVLAIICFAGGFVIIRKTWVCPHCSERLPLSGLNLERCPYCGRPLSESK